MLKKKRDCERRKNEKKKNEDKNLIQSKTNIRIKNVTKSQVKKNISSKKPVGKSKSNLSKVISSKKQVAKKSPKNQSEKMKLKDPQPTLPNPIEKRKLKDPQSTSPKIQVETYFENNIDIPQQDFPSSKTNEMFDEFISFKQEYMSNPENQKKILMSKTDDMLLSFLSIIFSKKTKLPISINLKDFKIYAKEKDITKNVIKDTIYQHLFDAFQQNPDSSLKFNYDVALMLLDNSPPDGMYNDIKQNFITEMTLRQFIKMKKKFGEDENKAYESATLKFNDYVCFKEIPSFDIIKQLYINELPNKNEGQLCNKFTDSIIAVSEKTDNSLVPVHNKRKIEKTDNELPNKNEGADSIIAVSGKTDNSLVPVHKKSKIEKTDNSSITKDEAYKIRSLNNFSLGKHFFYKNKNKESSVSCPVIGCECGNFSEIFDRYDDDVKKSILTQGLKENVAKVVDWSWDDWKYPKGPEFARQKQSMKKCILNHFVLFNNIFHDKNNLLKIPEKHLEMIKGIKAKHSVELLPKKWQKTLKDQIDLV